MNNRRAEHLYRRYGLREWQYDLIYKAQNGCCAICKKHSDKLMVDHDHNTNIVRGLLCFTCNTGLGTIEKNLQLLPAMLQYLGIGEWYPPTDVTS